MKHIFLILFFIPFLLQGQIIIDSYTETPDNCIYLYNDIMGGQSFTVSQTAIFVNIYNHSGTYGTSSIPTGDSIAYSDSRDVSLLQTSGQPETFIFSGTNKIQLTKDQYYVWQLRTSGVGGGKAVLGCSETLVQGHSGNYSVGIVYYSIRDGYFILYGTASEKRNNQRSLIIN